jgi:hypothetical protein
MGESNADHWIEAANMTLDDEIRKLSEKDRATLMLAFEQELETRVIVRPGIFVAVHYDGDVIERKGYWSYGRC